MKDYIRNFFRKQKNRNKISFLLVIALIFNAYIPNAVYASSEENRKILIDSLLEERAELVCLNQYDKIEEIDEQLELLGAKEITLEEIELKLKRNSSSSAYAVIPTANNVTWRSVESVYSYRGALYSVQTLIAQANEMNSNLKVQREYKIHGSVGIKKGIDNAIKVTVESLLKLATTTKLPETNILITIYDAAQAYIEGITPTTEIECSDPVYKCSHVTTAKFFYVKPYGSAGEGVEYCSYITTMGVTSVGGVWGTFDSDENGNIVPLTITFQSDTITTVPSGYSSEYNAVDAFVNGRQDKSYVDEVVVEGMAPSHKWNIKFLPPVDPYSIY